MAPTSKDMSGKERHGNLPIKATAILRRWLKNNIHNAYPTEDLKIQLAKETNLTIVQVSNWFINARRRYLPELIEDYRKSKSSQTGHSLTDKSSWTDELFFEDSLTDDDHSPSTERQKTLQKSGHLTSQNNSTYAGSSHTSYVDFEYNLKLLSSVACKQREIQMKSCSNGL